MSRIYGFFSKFGIILALLGLVLSLAPAARAQTPAGLKMSARPAFDGNFKYGEWLPLWVQLENSGPDLDGEVQVRVTGRGPASVFATPVSLPTGSRKQVTLYSLPNNFSHAMEVQFLSGSTLLASQSLTVRAQPNINYMVGIASPERGGLSILMTASLPNFRKLNLVDISLADIPDRTEGLRSFDAFILNATDTSILTPQQRTSLETWVRQGGRLVIGGGASALQTVSGLPESLLPLSVRSFTEVDNLSSLEDYAGRGEIRVSGPFVAATGSLMDGRVLAGDEEFPLVLEKSVGAGVVNWVSLDLASAPFDSWSAAVNFWEKLLGPTAAYPQWLPPDMSSRQFSSNQMIYTLSNLPSLDLPSIRSLTLLLAIYVVLVGPVNYLLLRWRRRLQWAWVTIPLITVIFSAGAYTIGYAMRGNDLILNRVLVAEIQPGGSAYVRSYFGLFSPSQTSYEIEVSGDSLVSQLTQDYDPWSFRPSGSGEVVLVQGEPNRLRGLAVNQWSMQSFMSEGVWSDSGQVSADLTLEENTLKGTIRNETPYIIENAVLVLGNTIHRLGTLQAGQELPISMFITDLIGQVFGPSMSYRILEDEFNKPTPQGPPRQLQLKQSVLDSVLPWNSGISALSSKIGGQSGTGMEVYLLGWFDPGVSDVLVSGRAPAQQTTGLIYSKLDYRLSDEGHISVLPGFFPGFLVQTPADGGTCGSGGTPSVYLGRGEAIFEFQLTPEYADANIHALQIHIATEGGWSRVPATSLYNWDNDAWMPIDSPVTGTNEVLYREGVVSSSQTVRVSMLSNDGSATGCYYVGLGLIGER